MREFSGQLLISGLALMLGACATSPPSELYVLRPVEAIAPAPAQTRELAVGVGPLSLPGYLDRPQIVTRTGPNRLALAEFDKWAEPLKDSLPALIAANLGVLLPSRQVHLYPWPRSAEVDYQITVDVLGYERTPDGRCTLEARWSIVDRRTHATRETRHRRYTTQVQGADYAAIVAAMNAALTDLTRDIADTLKKQAP